MNVVGACDRILMQAGALDAFPVAAFLVGSDGLLGFVSQHWTALTGVPAGQAIGTPFERHAAPEDAPRIRREWDQACARPGPIRLEYRMRFADGSYHWVLSELHPVDGNSDGAANWLGTSVLIDDRIALERAFREQAEFSQRLIESSDDCIKVLDFDGHLLSMSPNGQRLLEIPDVTPLLGTYWVDWWEGRDKEEALRALGTAQRGDTARFVGTYRRQGGDPRFFDVVVTPILDTAGRAERLLAVSREVTEQHRIAQERAFLAQATAILSQSLDLRAVLRGLAQLTVPGHADWCRIDLLVENGGVETMAVAHRDSALETEAARLLGRARSISEIDARSAVRTGRSRLLPRIDDQQLHELLAGEALYDALGVSSVLEVPITARGKVLGCLSLFYAGDRRYGEADLAMMEELGRRAGACVHNAGEFEREHRVAVSFQRACLPSQLPRTSGLTFSAVYLPGSAQAQVGGDWYDAFRLGDGRVVVAIGDVTGTGLEAAVVMASMRQVMRGIAHVRADPRTILDAADAALTAERPDCVVTAFVGIIDPGRKTLAFASAGHPPPLLRTPEGDVRQLSDGGLPLGLRDGASAGAGGEAVLAGGSVLVLYTDGVTENSRNLLEGERRLLHALATFDASSPLSAAQSLTRRVFEGPARDDVAMLVVQVSPDF